MIRRAVPILLVAALGCADDDSGVDRDSAGDAADTADTGPVADTTPLITFVTLEWAYYYEVGDVLLLDATVLDAEGDLVGGQIFLDLWGTDQSYQNHDSPIMEGEGYAIWLDPVVDVALAGVDVSVDYSATLSVADAAGHVSNEMSAETAP